MLTNIDASLPYKELIGVAELMYDIASESQVDEKQ